MKVASNLKDFVYKSIESDILAGNLHSGDIINEKDLVEKYGVSKSPVRRCTDCAVRRWHTEKHSTLRL